MAIKVWGMWGKSLAAKTGDLSLIIGTQERRRLGYHTVVFAFCPPHMNQSMCPPQPPAYTSNFLNTF